MTRSRSIVGIVIAIAVFWALVSPMIPTPTAVHHGKQFVAPVAILAAAVAIVFAPAIVAAAPFDIPRALATSSLLALTCSRLC